jgi:hypothetical protein
MSTIGNRTHYPEVQGLDGGVGANRQSRQHSKMLGAIRGGDVSSWASATSKPFGSVFKPIRPEVGPITRTRNPISSLGRLAAYSQALAKLSKVNLHDPSLVVMPSDSKDEGVTKAMESCDKAVARTETRIAVTNHIQHVLHDLRKGGTVREYAADAETPEQKLKRLNALRKAGVQAEYKGGR